MVEYKILWKIALWKSLGADRLHAGRLRVLCGAWQMQRRRHPEQRADVLCLHGPGGEQFVTLAHVYTV